MNHPEKLDVIDEQENIIDQVPRDEVHTKGLLHREVHVWLYTPDGKIIFQKRSATKDTFPNLLDASVGGHVDLGETPEIACIKELEEEAGIKANISELYFINKKRSNSTDPQTGKINNVIRYVYSYLYKGDIADLTLEEGKGDGFFAYSLSELKNLSDETRKAFISRMISDENIEMYKQIIIDEHARKIWDYMHLHHKMKPMDAIFILGSNDLRVADRASELYKQGLAPLIICSGGNGKSSRFEKTEAEMFSQRLIELGVPKEDILLETQATNTGENITNTQKLLKEKGTEINSFILVQKPYMERRSYATFKKQWEGPEIIVTSPQLCYEEYIDGDMDFKERFIETMVGDLQRIKEYPKLGFQTEQDIPDDVLNAWQKLVNMGYRKYYIDDFDLVYFKHSEYFKDGTEKVYDEQSKLIKQLLGNVEVYHIGGTSIPGLLTKGDLDLNIRVSQEDFKDVVKKLGTRYSTAQTSNWLETFASFKDYTLGIDFGIQVSVIGSKNDQFLNHQKLLVNNHLKIIEFNQLKKKFEGREMREYRKAKSEFLKSLIS